MCPGNAGTQVPPSGLSPRASGSPHGRRSGTVASPSGLHHPTVLRRRKPWWLPHSRTPDWEGGSYRASEMLQDKHIARKLIRSTQVTPRPGDHRLAHMQLRPYLRPLPQGRISPGLVAGPQLGAPWPLNRAVPNVLIVLRRIESPLVLRGATDGHRALPTLCTPLVLLISLLTLGKNAHQTTVQPSP